MKTAMVSAVALLLGLFLGGLGPRAELRQARKDLAEAKEAARGGVSAALPMALGIGSLAAARERARSVPRFVGAGADAGAAAPEPTADEEEGRGRRRRRSMFGDGGAQGFASAKAAVDVRAAQFRAAFVDEARLPPERVASLDQTVAQMNQEFAKAADEIAEGLRQRPAGGKLRPREMVDMSARLLEIYRRADDSFNAGLDEGARAARDRTEFDLLTQVDLGAFARLAETMESVGVTRLAP
jgi:hypothetical protein